MKNQFRGHPIVRQIVDRQHVAQSHRSVITAVVLGLRAGRSTFFEMSHLYRRWTMEEIVRVHNENRQIYLDVMKRRCWRGKP